MKNRGKSVESTTGLRKYCRGLLLALLISGCGKSVSEPAELIERAKAYEARGERNAAIIELRNALSQDPLNVEAQTLLGTISADSGEFLIAEAALSKALDAGAAPERVLPVLGRVLLEMEKYKELLDKVIPAPQLSSQVQGEIALLRGRAHMHLGAYADARTQFLLAMRDWPVEAKLGVAQLSATEGNIKVARSLVEDLLAASPDNADVWLYKGDLLRAEGKTDEALAVYGQAAKLKPSSVTAHLSQAMMHISKGAYEAARAEIATAQKLAPAAPSVHFTRALLAFREKKFEACREAIQQVGRQIPQHMPSTLLSGSLLFAIGQPEQAQKAYLTYLARYPGNIYARKMLAATLLRNAQPQSAAYVLEPLLARGYQDTELLTLAGQAYLQLGEIRRASRFLEQAVLLDPENPRARMNLGLTRLASGDKGQAIGDFEWAVALKPTDTRADSYLIMALVAQKQSAKALRAVQTLEQKEPDKPLTHLLKGAAYLAGEDIKGARASFEQALKLQPGYFPAAAALARMDIQEKDPATARTRIEAVLKHDKTNLDGMLLLAKFDLDAGRRDEALVRLRRTQAEHPDALQAYVMLAQVLLESGEANEAVTVAQQARDKNPRDPRAMEILGKAQLAAGNSGSAAVTLSTWIGLAPASVPAHLQLATALAKNGDYREAITAARKALQLDAANLEAMSILGEVFLETKRYRDMLELAQQAQKKYPQFGYALEGDALLAQQDYARAAAAYRKADAIRNSGPLRRRIHEAESRLAGGAASDAGLMEWVRRHPEDIETRLYLADVYSKGGRYKAAIEHYQGLLKSNPKEFRVLNNLAWALQQDGDPRALDYAQQAFQLKPDSASIADTLGAVLISQGKVNEGLQIMLKAVSLDPDSAEIRFHLAQTLVRVGDTARARNELKVLLASGKQFAQSEEAQALLKRLSQ